MGGFSAHDHKILRNSRKSWQWDDQTGDGSGITRVMGVEKVDDDSFKTILWLDIQLQ